MGFSELLGLTPQESNRKVLRKRKRLWNWQWYSSNALTMCLHFSAALGIHMTTFSGQWAISKSAMCYQQVFINWQGTPKMIFCHGNWGGFFFKLVKLEDEKTCSASISEQVTLLVPDKQNKKVEKKLWNDFNFSTTKTILTNKSTMSNYSKRNACTITSLPMNVKTPKHTNNQ